MTDKTPSVGVIGLGLIGGGVVQSLAHSGLVPSVYDVRADAADGLDGVSGMAASPAQVAERSDVVLLAVLDAAQARDVLIGDDGVLTARHEGLIVVLLSTVALSAVRELAEVCDDSGATLLDAGVTGGGRARENGLVVMVGGDDATVIRAMPVLEGFARAVIHCGPLGAGMATKIARNVTTYAIWASVQEAVALATAAGVRPDRLLAVHEHAADDPGMNPLLLLRAHANGRQAMPEDSVPAIERIARKDLAAAQELAGDLGVEVPITDLTRPRMGDVFRGLTEAPLPADDVERGLAMMDRVYGPGFGTQVPGDTGIPSIASTVEHLFAAIWSRPYLTIRDRRLLALGVTAMLGRADLLETQLRGGLANGEFTRDQLREISSFLPYYAGWGNGTVAQTVVERLIAEGAAP